VLFEPLPARALGVELGMEARRPLIVLAMPLRAETDAPFSAEGRLSADLRPNQP